MIQKAVTDFFIFCPPKCGTTSLFYMLSQHKELDPCSIKEPYFFSNKYHQGVDWYNQLYSETGLKFESSTNYFSSKKALKNILESCNRDVKYIIILRHPVDRIISHYKHFRAINIIRSNPTTRETFKSEISWFDNFERYPFNGLDSTFDDFMDGKKSNVLHKILLDSLYINHIFNIHTFVDQQNILYISYEKFKKDNLSTLNQIMDFLNISQANISLMQWNTVATWEKYTTVANEISSDIMQFLNSYYKPHSEKLQDYLGMKFDWSFD
jgi:hypothetical protein